MNTKQIEKKITDILTEGGIEPNEAKIEAKMLLIHFLKLTDRDFIFERELSDVELTGLETVEKKARLRAKTKTPIQQITGFAHFMGEDFVVNKNVLIPRDETEFLVRKAVDIINDLGQSQKEEKKQIKALDIGTGSGCIACMVAKLSPAQVIGVDISKEALQVALENASRMNLFNKAIFRKSDVFSNVNKGFLGDEFFDLIISNPPYIPPSEKACIQEEVKFDPELALYTRDNLGVEFYEKIAKEAPEFLNEGGYLLFELGIGQADLVKKIMEESGFKNIEVQHDLAGIERIIWGGL